MELTLAEKRKRSFEDKERAGREECLRMLGLDGKMDVLATLSDEEVAFCCEMVHNGLDRDKAYDSAYGGDGGELDRKARKRLAALMQREDVKQVLREGVRRRMSSTLDNLDSQLLDVYCQRAFYDVMDFHDSAGYCLPLHLIPQEKRCVIDRIDTKFYGKDGDVRSINYVLANRDSALKVLGEYMLKVRPADTFEVTSALQEDDAEQQLSQLSDEELRAQLRKLG